MEEKYILARNIKRLRDVENFTQEHVASFLGITRSAYSNYELGEREIPFCVLEKLSDLYGCDMYELYSEDSQVIENMLATAFRVDSLSAEDMAQLAAFKRIVKNSLKMDILLAR
ncbi:MAG: helix-turn-helix transcriptional regulator [Bacteroidales bacterium]|nr:helix-turn-helix transcriptional regulator [Bacteroidales bacterium]